MKLRLTCAFAFLLLSFFYSYKTYAQGGSLTLYVAPDGQPGNTGTIDKPFQRPEQAFDALKNKGRVNATIYIRGGHYSFTKSWVIAGDGIDPQSHITISGYQNERVFFSGGQRLDYKKLAVVTDPNILGRLPANARGKVYSIRLSDMGITDYGKQVPHGYKVIRNAPLEFFYNERALPVARYPNEGYMPIGTVTDPGANPRQGDHSNRGATFSFTDPRMSRWTQAKDAWVGGYFSFGYSDDYLPVDVFDVSNKTIKLKAAALYQVYSSDNTSNDILRNSQRIRGFYVYNLLEEIDQPGEWWLDNSTGILYVWPPDAFSANTDMEVSMLESPIVVISHIANLSFNNLNFEYGRSMGLLADDTRHVTITGCSFANLGTLGISTGNQLTDHKVTYSTAPMGAGDDYNSNLLIQNCRIFNTGTGGVMLEGGDRKTLTAANNTIDNCEIYNFSRINRTFTPGISLNGVGNHVTHCYIHDAPDQAIVFYGNDLTIEYNKIEKVTYYMTDAGSVGTGRDIATAGDTISYNLFANITSAIGSSLTALYLDDGTSGMEVDGNIFYKAGSPGTYHFGAIHINGGTDNIFRNNYFIDCGQAFSNSQWKDQQWKNVIADQGISKIYRPGVDVRSSLYTGKYKHLAKVSDTVNLVNRMNYSYNSLCYHVGTFSTGAGLTHNNPVVTQQDPGFANAGAGDFSLSVTPSALRQASDWKPVPFNRIGLKK